MILLMPHRQRVIDENYLHITTFDHNNKIVIGKRSSYNNNNVMTLFTHVALPS